VDGALLAAITTVNTIMVLRAVANNDLYLGGCTRLANARAVVVHVC
jgi:hypothetical protein